MPGVYPTSIIKSKRPDPFDVFARMHDGLEGLPTRQTFTDCGELSLPAIKTCLTDKEKIALSENDGNHLFQVFPDGQMVSTGLNVLLGERSSGKSHTLNRIEECHDNVKYIRQFSLAQQDDAVDEREFNSDVERRRSSYADKFLLEFKSVLDDVMTVDQDGNTRQVDNYVATLLKAAEEADRRDSFSRTALFDETAFSVSSDDPLKDLIASVRQLIENVDHRDLIEKHLNLDSLRRLACELIERMRARSLTNKKKQFVNGLVGDVKERLKIRSSAIQIEDVDLYAVALDRCKIKRFEDIVKGLRQESVVAVQF
jgi:hypothetical protein